MGRVHGPADPDAFPDWLEPMAATLTAARSADAGWIFERKFDGIRLLAFKQGGDVRVFSRNRVLRTGSHPAIASALASLPVRDAVLDGEVTWGGGETYHIFDVLYLDGRLLTAEPLDVRRALLAALPLHHPLELVARLDDAAPWDTACREGWEGVIAKRRNAPYEHRRSKHWLKMKCEARQAFVVGGFTDPQRSRKGLGALLVGYYDGDDLVFAGKVGTGFDSALLTGLRASLDAIELPAPPFTRGVALPRVRAHWTRPELVVDVAFIEWTRFGKLRHSRLLSLLPDRPPRTVRLETP